MGKEGLLIMLDMFLHYGVFVGCGEGNNFRQLSGNTFLPYIPLNTAHINTRYAFG